MTKSDIAREIAKATGLHQTGVKQIVQLTLDGIIDILASEGRLELRGFGVFQVKARKQRQARNPRTGEAALIPACRAVTFKAGREMQKRVGESRNGGTK